MHPWHLNFYRSLVVSRERGRKLLTLRYPSLGVTVSIWNKIILTSDLIRHFKKGLMCYQMTSDQDEIYSESRSLHEITHSSALD